MTDFAFKLVGGIGLFLVGMVLLTDGLKAFAGQTYRAGAPGVHSPSSGCCLKAVRH